MIATLLTVAALICLAVGARLLVTSTEHFSDVIVSSDEGKFVGTVTLIGGAVVFLLSTVAILVARRFAVSIAVEPDNWSGQLELSSIQEWSRDLATLRDDLRNELQNDSRREGLSTEQELEVEHLTIEVPRSWRARGDYLVGSTGQPLDPLADLRRTREQLMDAATRVDDIVQSINASTSLSGATASSARSRSRWWPW